MTIAIDLGRKATKQTNNHPITKTKASKLRREVSHEPCYVKTSIMYIKTKAQISLHIPSLISRLIYIYNYIGVFKSENEQSGTTKLVTNPEERLSHNKTQNIITPTFL